MQDEQRLESQPEAELEAAPATLAEPVSTEPVAAEPAPAGGEAIPEPPNMHWYILHTYSGFEHKVKESLRGRSLAFGFADRIGEILIPQEEVVEMRGGK